MGVLLKMKGPHKLMEMIRSSTKTLGCIHDLVVQYVILGML